MLDVTIWGALIAGLVSFLSPCVLPLVPPYLCYIGGVSIDQMTDGDGPTPEVRRAVILSSVAFAFGLATTFMAIGATAALLWDFVGDNQTLLTRIAGGIIILMGLHFLGVFKIGFLYREARFQSKGTGYIGSYIMGLAFAFGWTPCIGPVLGVILGIAATQDTVGQGAMLLAVYSAGLGIPFVLAAIFVKPFLSWLAKFKKNLGLVEKAMGGLLVLTGILFMTGGMQTMANWMLRAFPGLATIG